MRVAMASLAGHPGRANEDFVAALPAATLPAAVRSTAASSTAASPTAALPAASLPVAAVLIDGADIPGMESVCHHGVAWYASRLGSSLLELLALGPDRALVAVLAEAIARVTAEHRGTCDVADPISPSAAVALLRVTASTVDYLVLGDATLVVSGAPSAPPHVSQQLLVTDPHVPQLVVTDPREPVISRAYESRLKDVAAESPEYHHLLRELRSHRNQPGGFWLAKDDPYAAEEAVTGSRPLAGVNSAALLSNGASRLVDTFHLADWAGALALLASSGPDELLRRVRRAEADRAHPSDDATIAFCTDLTDFRSS
ncbi:hypothetical protein [Actinoplanes sp. NPDC051851]|uniref:hypothetical protein n=1 Tax=Actinoplanes sp. NPDC051851 TaxID=3154753 RepID=UPI00342C9104